MVRFGDAQIELAARRIEREAKRRGVVPRQDALQAYRDTEAIYRTICVTVADRATAALALRPGAGGLRLWLRPTVQGHMVERPGALAVAWEQPGPEWQPVSFRPHRDADEFGWLARSDFATAVWHACRSAPILGLPTMHVIGHDGVVTELPA